MGEGCPPVSKACVQKHHSPLAYIFYLPINKVPVGLWLKNSGAASVWNTESSTSRLSLKCQNKNPLRQN